MYLPEQTGWNGALLYVFDCVFPYYRIWRPLQRKSVSINMFKPLKMVPVPKVSNRHDPQTGLHWSSSNTDFLPNSSKTLLFLRKASVMSMENGLRLLPARLSKSLIQQRDSSSEMHQNSTLRIQRLPSPLHLLRSLCSES